MATQDLTSEYVPAEPEVRWQEAWHEAGSFRAPDPHVGGEPAYVVAYGSASSDVSVADVRGYVIADAYARYLRANGHPVLFSIGCDMSSTEGHLEAQSGTHSYASRLTRLGLSFDEARLWSSNDPDTQDLSERLRLELSEEGLLYRDGEQRWRIRGELYAQDNALALDDLEGWNRLALSSQRQVLGSIEGVELDLAALDGRSLTVFTPYDDAVAQAQFVVISPLHPDIDQWAGALESMDSTGLADTGCVLMGAGTPLPLPVYVAPSVDERFGATAVLGIPAVDAFDGELAQQLPASAGMTWRVKDDKPAKLRPAVRHRVGDSAVSGSGQGAWTWLGACVPTGERSELIHLLAHPDVLRWLPAVRLVCGADRERDLFNARTVAKALHKGRGYDGLPGGEPFTGVTMYEAIADSDDVDIGELIELAGADAVRLAVLYAAAPATSLRWTENALRYSQRWLAGLWKYALPRLSTERTASGIEQTSKHRRRLTCWCETATARTTENLERLDTHLAVRNAIRLLERIKAFEQLALGDQDVLSAEDQCAVDASLRLLLRLLVPLAPHISEELWARAGQGGLLADTPWPKAGECQRV